MDNKLKRIRVKNNISMQEMADILKISKTFYWQLENKKRRLAYDMAVKIADIFSLKPDEIFYEEFKNKE